MKTGTVHYAAAIGVVAIGEAAYLAYLTAKDYKK